MLLWLLPLLLLYPTTLYSDQNKNETGAVSIEAKELPPIETVKNVEPTPAVAVKAEPNVNNKKVYVNSNVNNTEQSIIKWAVFYGVDQDTLLRIADCESTTGRDPNAYNGNSGHYGLFQYKTSTWASKSSRAGFAGADVLDNDMNARVTAWAFSKGEGDAWECQ